MNKKARFEIFTFPVYANYRVHVETASDIEEAMRQYPATKDAAREAVDAAAITVHVKEASTSFIFFKNNPEPTSGVVAHECYHVVRRMLSYMGCEMDNENVAYHLGYLVNQVTPFVKRKTKRR